VLFDLAASAVLIGGAAACAAAAILHDHARIARWLMAASLACAVGAELT
jgi:hypothetical protein